MSFSPWCFLIKKLSTIPENIYGLSPFSHIKWWFWTLSRPQGQTECCTERGRKAWTLSLPWKARKPLFFYSSSHPCFALYLLSFALLSSLFSVEHLGPNRCQCCGYRDTHTRTQGYTWAWERQLKRDKFIQRSWLTVKQGRPKCPLYPGVTQKLLTPFFS